MLTKWSLNSRPDEDLRPCCDSIISSDGDTYDQRSCFGVLWKAVDVSQLGRLSDVVLSGLTDRKAKT